MEVNIPEVDIEGIRCVSGHFYGVHVNFGGDYLVEFCIREGFEGSDLLILRQEVTDDNYTLDKAVEMGRRVLADNLEQLAKDIRTGDVKPDSEEDLRRLADVETSLKEGLGKKKAAVKLRQDKATKN